jgi:zinc and cadmium transporter
MSALTPILIATFIGSVGALLGGGLLLLGKRISDSVVHVLVSFAAGALIGTALFELLPEALGHAEEAHEASGGEINIFFWTLLGILIFYILDRAIHWFQFHQHVHKGSHGSVSVPLVILGDSLHNFIDGVAIALTFLVNPALGVTTTLAVLAHEIPQEIGDFAVLLHEGMSRKKVFLINIFTALLAVVGALLAMLIGEQIEGILPYALSLTAGFFLYIALSNLLPEIHREEKKGYAFIETAFFLLGVAVIWAAMLLIPHGHGH